MKANNTTKLKNNLRKLDKLFTKVKTLHKNKRLKIFIQSMKTMKQLVTSLKDMMLQKLLRMILSKVKLKKMSLNKLIEFQVGF
jgi:hypothetical protein